MDDQSLWQLMRESWMKLEAHYEPAIEPLVAESKLNSRAWMVLLAALTFEPEDTTPSHLLVRGPYTSSERYLMLLENAVDQEYLIRTSGGRFQLSPTGRAATQEFIRLAREAMVMADPLDVGESQDLAEMLDHLVNKCFETPPPPNTWSISLSKKLMPPIDPQMPFIEQAISCLAAYRDDAHLASWQSSGLSAISMETMTVIWRGQASTLEELTDKLSNRGHPKKVYVDALTQLRTREYVSGSRSVLRLTEYGKLFRDRVEAKTDQYFYTPWSCLTDDEKNKLAVILKNLIEKL
jgi:hypothetical protein